MVPPAMELLSSSPDPATPVPSGGPLPTQIVPCAWCRESLVDARRAKYCSRRCRQSAFRLRRRRDPSPAAGCAAGLTFAYADPPYPGLSAKYYRQEASFAGEVNCADLIASLTAAGYAGWALSTSSKALRDILPLCPEYARVCAWVKPIGVPRGTYGLHSRWEALVVVGGRKRRPGVRDWLRAQPARGWGSLMGRKPLAFCAWLFDCLGMVAGDELVDLYPGTGAVTRAWLEVSPAARASLLEERRPGPVSPGAGGTVGAAGATTR